MRIAKHIREELQAYIDKHTTLDTETGCHNWGAKTSRDDYGRIAFKNLSDEAGEYLSKRFGNKSFMQSHRVAFLINGGSLTKDKPMVLHKCDNPKCCNPKHLFPGNNTMNATCLQAMRKRSLTAHIRYSPETIGEIRQMILDGYSFRSIHKKYGMDISHLSTSVAKKLEAEGWQLPQRAHKTK